MSTRRMTRFTLRAWLGEGEIATTRRLTWEMLSSYRVSRWVTRMHGIHLDNSSRPAWDLYFVHTNHFLAIELWSPSSSSLWFQLGRYQEWIHPSGSRARSWMHGISRQDSETRPGNVVSQFLQYYAVLFVGRARVMDNDTKGVVVVLQGRVNVSQAILVHSSVAESSVNSELPLSCVKVSKTNLMIFFIMIYLYLLINYIFLLEGIIRFFLSGLILNFIDNWII